MREGVSHQLAVAHRLGGDLEKEEYICVHKKIKKKKNVYPQLQSTLRGDRWAREEPRFRSVLWSRRSSGQSASIALDGRAPRARAATVVNSIPSSTKNPRKLKQTKINSHAPS